jgi:hypothetical protein
MILRPAQKIEVVESNRQCKAGSIGYFICQDSVVSGYNVWRMAAVFTRYGKKGKRRIGVLEFPIHMLSSDQLKESDKKIVDIVKFVEGLDPRSNFNKHKSRREKERGLLDQHGIDESKIIPIDIECKNLLDLDTWDFLGYLTALSIYLNRLCHNKLSSQLVSTPLLMRLCEFVEHKDLRLMPPDYVGYYIIMGLEYDAQNKNKSFEDIYLNLFNNHAMRKECLDKIIMGLVMAKDRDTDYKTYILQVYKDMEATIAEILLFYRENKRELKFVQKGEEEYKNSANGPIPVSPKHQAALSKQPAKEERHLGRTYPLGYQ